MLGPGVNTIARAIAKTPSTAEDETTSRSSRGAGEPPMANPALVARRPPLHAQRHPEPSVTAASDSYVFAQGCGCSGAERPTLEPTVGAFVALGVVSQPVSGPGTAVILGPWARPVGPGPAAVGLRRPRQPTAHRACPRPRPWTTRSTRVRPRPQGAATDGSLPLPSRQRWLSPPRWRSAGAPPPIRPPNRYRRPRQPLRPTRNSARPRSIRRSRRPSSPWRR